METVYRLADLVKKEQFVLDEVLEWFQDSHESEKTFSQSETETAAGRDSGQGEDEREFILPQEEIDPGRKAGRNKENFKNPSFTCLCRGRGRDTDLYFVFL